VADLGTIADAADALTNPIRVREPLQYWDANRNRKIKYYEHTLPSLLDQLHRAIIPGEVYVEDQNRVHRTPRSMPPGRLEAINALMQIEAGAALWIVRVRLTLRESAPSNIRALVGAQTDSDQASDILADLRRWYSWAATLTGWERPPWRPNAPCPACEHHGLRVHLARQTAACVNCGAGWTPDTIGILGDYVTGLTSTGA